MRVFWRNKEGKSAPPKAQFQLIDFSDKTRVNFSEIVDALPQPQKLHLKSRTDLPNKTNWCLSVQQALNHTQLEKVVLARQTTLTFDQPIDPFRLTAALQPYTRGAALTCAELANGSAFITVSPERLFRRTHYTLITEALAGTKPIGVMHTEKELREFTLVQQYLEQRLKPFCSSLTFSPTRVHQTATVQHLFSEGHGNLHHPHDEPLLSALHPTPAVCGTPKQAAYDYLLKTEPFPRGFYAGVFGWHTPEASEWVVGIRSCLVEHNTLRLYTGAGIVPGSDPEAEWDELEAKLALYRDVCGL